MKLFKYEGYTVTISEEALLLKPFADIWKRDRSKSKQRALSELAYVYFYADPRSDFSFIIDDKLRMEKIIEGEGMKDNWKPDKLVLEAIKFYQGFKTTSSMLLDTARYLADKLMTQMKTIDLDERDNNNKPIFAINMIADSIKKVNSLVLELNDTEKKLASELRESSTMRGQGEKSIMEDSLDI